MKLIQLLSAVALAFILAACGSPTSTPSPAPAPAGPQAGMTGAGDDKVARACFKHATVTAGSQLFTPQSNLSIEYANGGTLALGTIEVTSDGRKDGILQLHTTNPLLRFCGLRLSHSDDAGTIEWDYFSPTGPTTIIYVGPHLLDDVRLWEAAAGPNI